VQETTLREMRDLLEQIRDLLRPVADAYQDQYERRLAERAEQQRAAVAALLSNPKRKKAWALADGTLTQTAIAVETGIDKSDLSKFFKRLRDLGALLDDTNPTRAIEVD